MESSVYGAGKGERARSCLAQCGSNIIFIALVFGGGGLTSPRAGLMNC